MILPMIADRIRTGIYNNLNILLSIFIQAIYVRNNPYCILNFIWNILKEFLAISHANNLTVIIKSNINVSPLCISKTTYPFQIFISP